MPTKHLKAQNIKCDGCAKTIREGLAPLAGIDRVDVEVSTGEVTLHGENWDLDEVRKKLAELGYPPAE
jgi:copper chaperone CopZ